MISGFKIGLRDWKEKLELTHPKFVEVYFRVDKIKEYETMFDYLRAHQIKFGLHFWGVLKSGIEPNLLSRHKWIQNQSYFLMQEAIKIGVEANAVYVNFHPGALRERIIDLDKNTYQLAKLKETEFEEGRENLLKNAKRLQDSVGDDLQVVPQDGQTRRSVPTIIFETLPTNSPIVWTAPRGPNNMIIAKQCPIEFYEDLARAGFAIANDFGHTTASSVGARRAVPLQHLQYWTKTLARSTKLIHCNLTLPPFDGIDTHSGLLPEDFAKDTLPNKEELLELLKIFKDREDVYILNEPEDRHVENYHALVAILNNI